MSANNGVRFQVHAQTRIGKSGLLALPGEWNGFTCFAYGPEESLDLDGCVSLEWVCGNYIWQTEPFSLDLIYTYIWQKTKGETEAFLNAVGQRSWTAEYKAGTKEKIGSFLHGREIYFVAAILACVVLGGSDV